MAMSIRNPEVERIARDLARKTGETLTAAILIALRERLQRVTVRRRSTGLALTLNTIAKRCAALPILDQRPEDDILGYDARGLPRPPSSQT